jgi:hypothetical protein
MEPDKEPTKHLIADLKAKKQYFEDKGSRIIFLFRTEKEKRDFVAGQARELPSSSIYLVPAGFNMKRISSATLTTAALSLPVVTLINENGEILYLGQGYHIGTGDDLARLLN